MLLLCWSRLVNFFSFEWILTKTRRSNGGDIIVLRSLLTALSIFILFTAVKHLLDPNRLWAYNGQFLHDDLFNHLTVLGALIGGVYAALYTRFAAQWTYLANLFNQINETEARTISDPDARPIIAQWKAGFLEDAEELHLATKSLFASVLKRWGDDAQVKSSFVTHTPGREDRFNALMQDVKNANERHDAMMVKWSKVRPRST